MDDAGAGGAPVGGDAASRRKRAFAARKAANRAAKHCVVKASLAGRVRSAALRAHIDALVTSVSQLVHKASLLLNAVLQSLCNTEDHEPLLETDFLIDATQASKNAFIHLFTVGTGRGAYPALLRDTWATLFDGWPPVERVTGDTQVITYAAAQLHTNLVTSCTHAFEGRLKWHVRRWVAAQNGLEAAAVWPVFCGVLGVACRTAVPPTAAAWVAQQRARLGLAAGELCDIAWRKAHVMAVVRYYHHILRAMEGDAEARRFTLAPVAEIKRHFITLDTKALRSSKLFDDIEDDDAMWDAAFDVRGLRGGAWENGATVQTDGVALCIKLKLPDAAPPKPAAGAKKRKRESAPAAAADTTTVLAIDPGRSTLMHGVARHADGSETTHTLTRRAWYNAAGKPRADARRARWNLEVAEAHAALSDVSPKTARLGDFLVYLAVVRTHYAALWAHKLHVRWRREDLRFHRLKHAAMDRWLAGVKRQLGGDDVKVAYGAAVFAATGRGEEAPAPTAFQYKRLLLAFGQQNVTLVNEDFTTKCCAACGARGETTVLQNVFEDRAAARPIRGLKRCNATECCSFRSRDGNAARNILAAFLAAARGAPRPTHLCRDTPGGHAKPTRWNLHTDPPQEQQQTAAVARNT